MRRKSAWLLATTLVFSGFVACSGGDGGGRDFGFEDVPEEVAQDAEDPGADPGAEDPGVEDPGPVDPGPVDPGTDVGPVTCQTNQDCQDVPMTLEPCHRKVCLKPQNLCGQDWDPTCCFEGVFLNQGFESGLAGWKVEDSDTNDRVTWSVTTNRKAAGTRSLYLGDPQCRTYYTGPLDESCDPVDRLAGQGATVRVAVTSPVFLVPPLDEAATTFVLSMYLWMDTEDWDPQAPEQPDVLSVMAIPKGGTVLDGTEVLSSVAFERTSGGNFVHVAANLGEFRGSEISLRILFDSLDEERNHFEGVYVDELKVYSTCASTCTAGTDCASDDDACTDDACSGFANQEGTGVCAYPKKPECLEPVCTAATVAADCPTHDVCRVPACTDGACVYTVIPEQDCCRFEALMDIGFEGGAMGDFQFWAYQDNQTVKWQPSTKRAANGTGALYYGNLAALNYVTAGAVANFGEATSPAIELAPLGNYFLSFNLFLSTEFDGKDPEKYANPLGADFFEVLVVENPAGAATTTRVWSSHLVHGTTGGAFLPVGVDLSDFKGKTIAIRFRFDTSDDVNNNFEGVYVDDVIVSRDTCVNRDCGGPQDCLIDGVCRTGDCTDNQCDVTVIGEPPTCCASMVQCDDDDPCTADSCQEHVCVHDAFEGPNCCLARTVQRFAFDGASPLDGFTVADQGTPGPGGMVTVWAPSEVRSYSTPRSLRFGNVTNYDNGGIAKASALSPEITVPALGDYVLQFRAYLDIEDLAITDLFFVDILQGATPTQVATKAVVPSGSYRTWYEVGPIDLNAWRGKKIQIRFRFDSVSAEANLGQGVFVDDVEIRKVCP